MPGPTPELTMTLWTFKNMEGRLPFQNICMIASLPLFECCCCEAHARKPIKKVGVGECEVRSGLRRHKGALDIQKHRDVAIARSHI
mmetsp:Transcript_13164/g.22559  ORF Transcript_13164/g.22559 Transcript_13164/m.22559 type:complete len:86 (-) Transcript_13164:105-362(-)